MARLQQLIDLQRSITRSRKEARCRGRQRVLVEQISKKDSTQYLGRTEHDEMVVFSPSKDISVGDFVTIELQTLVGNTMTGVHVVDI
jgi:tRNA-2-methylthio-N6-dimethylallyladenosine synthase